MGFVAGLHFLPGRKFGLGTPGFHGIGCHGCPYFPAGGEWISSGVGKQEPCPVGISSSCGVQGCNGDDRDRVFFGFGVDSTSLCVIGDHKGVDHGFEFGEAFSGHLGDSFDLMPICKEDIGVGEDSLQVLFRIGDQVLSGVKGNETCDFCNFRVIDGICCRKVYEIHGFGFEFLEFRGSSPVKIGRLVVFPVVENEGF